MHCTDIHSRKLSIIWCFPIWIQSTPHTKWFVYYQNYTNFSGILFLYSSRDVSYSNSHSLQLHAWLRIDWIWCGWQTTKMNSDSWRRWFLCTTQTVPILYREITYVFYKWTLSCCNCKRQQRSKNHDDLLVLLANKHTHTEWHVLFLLKWRQSMQLVRGGGCWLRPYDEQSMYKMKFVGNVTHSLIRLRWNRSFRCNCTWAGVANIRSFNSTKCVMRLCYMTYFSSTITNPHSFGTVLFRRLDSCRILHFACIKSGEGNNETNYMHLSWTSIRHSLFVCMRSQCKNKNITSWRCFARAHIDTGQVNACFNRRWSIAMQPMPLFFWWVPQNLPTMQQTKQYTAFRWMKHFVFFSLHMTLTFFNSQKKLLPESTICPFVVRIPEIN